jgi:general L-amino acid transport system substrate-binding protein
VLPLSFDSPVFVIVSRFCSKRRRKMIERFTRSRWAIFVVGMIIGMIVLVACGAASQTAAPAATEEMTEQPAAETEQPAAETEQPAATTEEVAPPVQEGESTLAVVQARGSLKCGVNAGQPGFGSIDANGAPIGFDVDFCRAVAAAVLGDATAVEFIALTADQRLPALQTGEIDVLSRNTTWTLTRDADLGLDYTITTFYDGQGFIVRAADGITSVEELAGGTVCVTSGTTTEANLADVSENRGLNITPNVYADNPEAFGVFVEGACDAYTGDKSGLAGFRASVENPDDYVILVETISKEPLGPLVRANDSDWRDAVVWTAFAMLESEELGISQANVDDFLDDTGTRAQRLLGTGEDDLGSLLGLPKDFAYQVIKQVGNYADVYERHLTPIGIARAGTSNALWTDGGLLYAPAWR